MKNPFKELTFFEKLLWTASIVTVLIAFVLSPDKDVLSLIASALGVTALIFVARAQVLGQVLTVVFAVFYGIISLYFKYYGELITYMGMTAPIAVFSIISWLKHPYKQTAQVEINKPSVKKWLVLYIFTAIVTAAFYFILRALGTENLFWSTVSVATSFLASSLTFLRSPYYAVAYAANDVVLIILWVLASITDISYLPMVACFAAFLANDIYGFINWKKIEKIQAQDIH